MKIIFLIAILCYCDANCPDGLKCSDIDECTDGNHDCESQFATLMLHVQTRLEAMNVIVSYNL